MKKLYAFIFTLGLLGQVATAQIDVTFQVDLTDYLAAGNTLQTVKIAGNFTTAGASLPDWDPTSAPAFTDLGDNVWSATITFDASATGNSLEFKFLNTADTWGACDVEQECLDADAGACSNQPSNDNRLLVIPAQNTSLCFKWDGCTACGASAVGESYLDLGISIAPNPFNDVAVVTFGASVNNAEAVLSSLTGQVVRAYQVTNNTLEIQKDNLQSGVYFLTMITEEGRTVAQKIIVE